MLDATCTPADVRYPTDLSLLNEAREKTEKAIDTLYNRDLGLARIMARLKETAESVIALQFLVMNLERRLRILFCHFICAILKAFYSRSGTVYMVI